MEYVLAGLQWEHCLIYLDDIIVFSSTFEEHIEKLTKVFQRLREEGLKLKPKKCFFAKSSVKYLGHIVSQRGLEPDPEKIKAVTEYPRPQSASALRSFLGLAGYYRRFISGFLSVAAPLFQLQQQSQKKPLIWTEDSHHSFCTLQQKFISAPILAFPQFEVEFILATDASDTGLGKVLSQIQHGKERVIAYASRVLHKSEKSYSTIEKETLAVVWAVNNFRPYLYGRLFTLITDHCPLTWLKSIREPRGRLARWILLLSEYEWSICHRPGKQHTNADALFRHQPPSVNMAGHHATLDESFEEIMAPVGAVHDVLGAVRMTPTWSYRELCNMQAANPIMSQVLAQFPERSSATGRWRSHPKLIVYRRIWHQLALDDAIPNFFRPATPADGGEDKQLLVLPTCLIPPVLDQLHDNEGHFEADKTLGRVSDTCWWPGYTKDIHEYIQSCEMCSRKKPMSKAKAMLQNVPVGGPMEMIGLDFIGPLPSTEAGNKHVLVVVDYFTK